jgi:hypothetical protein
MRLYWVIPAFIVCGCVTHETVPLVSMAYGRHVVEEAWGEGFEAGKYDISRELSREERDDVEQALAEKGHGRGHAGAHSVGFGVPAEGVVAEVTLLQPGCALAFCAATPPEKSAGLRSFVVVTRGSLEQLSSVRVMAVSPAKAIALSKLPPEPEPSSAEPEPGPSSP